MEHLNRIPPRPKMVYIDWRHYKKAVGTLEWNGVTAKLWSSGSPTGCCSSLRCYLQYTWVPKINTFFNISLKCVFKMSSNLNANCCGFATWYSKLHFSSARCRKPNPYYEKGMWIWFGYSFKWVACLQQPKPIPSREVFSRRPCLNASTLLWNTNNIMWIQQQGDTHRQFRERGWALKRWYILERMRGIYFFFPSYDVAVDLTL